MATKNLDDTMLHSVQTLRADISYITSHLCTLEDRPKRQVLITAMVTSVFLSLGAPYIIDLIFPKKGAVSYPDTRSDESLHRSLANFEEFVNQVIRIEHKTI